MSDELKTNKEAYGNEMFPTDVITGPLGGKKDDERRDSSHSMEAQFHPEKELCRLLCPELLHKIGCKFEANLRSTPTDVSGNGNNNERWDILHQ